MEESDYEKLNLKPIQQRKLRERINALKVVCTTSHP